VKSLQHLPDRPRQRGQAIVWFLATIAACCCTFALVYNIGQVANTKETTVNAADAAALSGALVEARMLNFEAYTNRAMIANEVTVAQLVSLDSLIGYANEFIQWVAIYTSIVPILDDITSAAASATEAATEVANGVLSVAIQAPEGANALLYGAREVANLAAPVAAKDVSDQIASANGAQTSGNFASEGVVTYLNATNWLNFTDPYNNGSQRDNAKNVILNSRDVWSSQRGDSKAIDFANDAMEVAGLIASAGTGYVGLQKTSGTATLQDYDHWSAQDSIDLTIGTIKFCYVVIPCGYDTHLDPTGPPIAYGRTDADADGSTGSDLCNYKPTTTNCTMAVENSYNMYWDGPVGVGNGIPTIRDLAKDLQKPCSSSNVSDSPSLTYVVAVTKPASATQTTQQLGMNTVNVTGPQGSPSMVDDLQGNNLTSIAAGCAFFLRPDSNKSDITEGNLARADGVHEYASLYNPYWQARLTTPDSKLKTLLYGLIGQPGVDGYTP